MCSSSYCRVFHVIELRFAVDRRLESVTVTEHADTHSAYCLALIFRSPVVSPWPPGTIQPLNRIVVGGSFAVYIQ